MFLVLSSISYITSEHALHWDIGLQLCYISYFLVGYKIRMWAIKKKNTRLGMVFISAGCGVNFLLAVINYLRSLNSLPVDAAQISKNPFSFAPLAPFEVMASVLIFSGFSLVTVKKDFSRVSGYTFLIYLLHVGVLEVILLLIEDKIFGNVIIETMAVIIISAIVFIISFLVALIYKKITTHRLLSEKGTN